MIGLRSDKKVVRSSSYIKTLANGLGCIKNHLALSAPNPGMFFAGRSSLSPSRGSSSPSNSTCSQDSRISNQRPFPQNQSPYKVVEIFYFDLESFSPGTMNKTYWLPCLEIFSRFFSFCTLTHQLINASMRMRTKYSSRTELRVGLGNSFEQKPSLILNLAF